MKNILIPTDFSMNSWNAIIYGLAYFKNTSCTFYLIHVTLYTYPLNGDAPIGSSLEIEETLLNNATAELKKTVKKINNLFPNKKHSFHIISSYNFFIDAVKKVVKENNIDLIVMGTKGASGLTEMIIGSNTADLITQVKCPVLIVPENATYNVPEEIAFPTDYNIYYNPDILIEIIDLAKEHASAIRILHVAKKGDELTPFQNENKDLLNNFFANEKHSFHLVTNKKVALGIQCFIESRNIDIMVMIAKNINLFQRILFKPTVEDISYHTKIPFLVLHE
jgi:nucleotide-binding universal stress UspA family protein